MRAEDAEETLFQLGFGCEEPQVTARIPVRFFNFPSQLRGINFRLFLESQLSRIRQEDPCLSLASKEFRVSECCTYYNCKNVVTFPHLHHLWFLHRSFPTSRGIDGNGQCLLFVVLPCVPDAASEACATPVNLHLPNCGEDHVSSQCPQ